MFKLKIYNKNVNNFPTIQWINFDEDFHHHDMDEQFLNYSRNLCFTKFSQWINKLEHQKSDCEIRGKKRWIIEKVYF